MNESKHRSTRSIVIRVFLLYAALVGVACGIFGIFAVKDGLESGQVCSLAIVLGSGAQVYRDSSPGEYWFIIGFYIFGGLAGLFFGTATLIGTLFKFKKGERRDRGHDEQPEP